MNEKEQQLAYQKAWRNVIGTEWLFPNHYDYPVSLVDYMDEWVRISKGDFFAFRGPISYKTSLLEKFKDNIVSTNQVFSADGTSWLDTIVQIDRNSHLIANWNWSTDETCHILSVGLYVKDPAVYAKFLKEHQSYEFKESSRHTGFSSGSGFGVRN